MAMVRRSPNLSHRVFRVPARCTPAAARTLGRWLARWWLLRPWAPKYCAGARPDKQNTTLATEIGGQAGSRTSTALVAGPPIAAFSGKPRALGAASAHTPAAAQMCPLVLEALAAVLSMPVISASRRALGAHSCVVRAEHSNSISADSSISCVVAASAATTRSRACGVPSWCLRRRAHTASQPANGWGWDACGRHGSHGLPDCQALIDRRLIWPLVQHQAHAWPVPLLPPFS
jgi:hypothetical protein